MGFMHMQQMFLVSTGMGKPFARHARKMFFRRGEVAKTLVGDGRG